MEPAVQEDVQQFQTENDLGQIEVDWSKPPALADLKYDLEQTRSYHTNQKQKIETWLDNLYVEGKAKRKPVKGRSSVVPKLIRKQAEWRYAALTEPFLNNDKIFESQPATWEDRESAKQSGLVLNHQFNNEINKISFIDEYVRTSVDEGTVICRCGWEYKEEEYTVEEPVIELDEDPSMTEVLNEIGQLKLTNPNEFYRSVPQELQTALEHSIADQKPYRPRITGTETIEKTRIIKNSPTVEVCDFRNVRIDPTCEGDISKAKFIVFSYTSSQAELQEDGRYKNLDRINISDSDILNEPDHAVNDMDAGHFKFNDNPRKKLLVHEYWGLVDVEGNGELTAITASWVGDTYIYMAENPFPDKEHPFVLVQYLPVRKAIYGEPDGALLEDNQEIHGAVTRGMIDLMGRSANGQMGVRKGFLDATNRRKFEKGEPYEYNLGADPRQAVYTHEFPDIPQSAQFMLQLQNQEAESITGVKSFSTGLSGESFGEVAAGVRSVLDSASKRELGILRRLSYGMVQIGRKFQAMNAEFLSETEVIRVTNDEFVEVRKEELAGKYDIKLSVSTAEEDNAKAEQMGFLLQTIGNTTDFRIANMLLAQLFELRKLPDLAEQIRNFEPEPDPVQEQIQQLEVQKLQAEIAKIYSETQENQTQSQLNQGKTGTEQAKSGLIQAQADKSSLDFVEQESGVTQERDLEKQKAQSQGNIELEHAKAGIEADKEGRQNQAEASTQFLDAYLKSKSEDNPRSTNTNI